MKTNNGLLVRSPAAAVFFSLVVATVVGSGGCQSAKPVSDRRLIAHRALIDFSGLKPVEYLDGVKVSLGAPRQWEQRPLVSTGLYTHQQWRSPSGNTGVGVAYVRLPLPLGEGMLLWFAKREYTKRANDGRVIGQWRDELGRPWFEAENDKYHVRGFATARGFSAWFVYFGHRTGTPPDPAEISLAARCAETIVPEFKARHRDEGAVASTAEPGVLRPPAH